MMNDERVDRMKAEMQDVLEQNILRFWLDKMQDHENGGFYGRMDGRMQLHPEAEKGAILNARILWSFSAAYRVLSEVKGQRSEVRGKRSEVRDYIYNLQGQRLSSLQKGLNIVNGKKVYVR